MSKCVCLIVDDEPAVRTYLSLLLEKHGMQTLQAANAVDALRIIQGWDGQIDLLISDIYMPGDMSGIELANWVKTSFPKLPVILVSGFTDRPPSGFNFVPKPFTCDAILKAIDKVMTKSCSQGG